MDERDQPRSEGRGGENVDPEEREPTHETPPANEKAKEPLGPMTPDPERPLGDTSEAHDEITEHDIPKDHPGRKAAEDLTGGGAGTTRGNQ